MIAGDGFCAVRSQDQRGLRLARRARNDPASGETRLATNFEFNVGKHVAYFDATATARMLAVTPDARLCEERPGWYVAEREDKLFAGEVELGAPDCRLTYRFVRSYGKSGLSQTPWGLYRLAP